MEFLESIDIYPKIIVSLTGLIAAFIKIRETYSSTRRKLDIKLDLEIYELINKSGDFEKSELKDKIEKNITNSIDREENGLTNFFVGIVVFVGFGLWSIDIFQTYTSFNGWIILTSFFSVTGLSMLFDRNNKKKPGELFYQIGFYDKSNFQIGFIITVSMSILTPILILKMEGFSFWQFVSGLFFVIGLISLVKNTKRIK